MSTTTFKGARYIVKFADPIEWSDDRAYEAIEAVQYNGFTYLSKQPVPIGVQIDNTSFWLEWADPNAQMEQLRETVAGYVSDVEDMIIGKAEVFATVSDMKSATLEVGMTCRTNGFNNEGDNGAAWYIIVEAANANEMDIIACGDLYAVLISGIDNPSCYGADPNNTIDSATAINRCIEVNKGSSVNFMPGTYKIESAIETPSGANDRVSIDFNGATIVCSASMNYALGIGYESGSETDSGILRTFFQNGIIKNNSNTEVGVEVKTGYKDSAISNMNIIGFKKGIRLGDGSSLVPGDCQITNCFIRYNDMIADSRGIEFNVTDNKVNDCRIYGFKYSLYFNASGNWITNVHNLPKSNVELNSTILNASVFAYLNSNYNTNFFNKCYCDTYGKFIHVASGETFVVHVTNCEIYSYRSDLEQIFIDASAVTNIMQGVISDNIIRFRGVNNQKTIKLPEASDLQRVLNGSLKISGNILQGYDSYAFYYGDLFTLKPSTRNQFVRTAYSVTNEEWVRVCAIPLMRVNTAVMLEFVYQQDSPIVENVYFKVKTDDTGIIQFINSPTTQTRGYNYGMTVDKTTFNYPIAYIYIQKKTNSNMTVPLEVRANVLGVTDTYGPLSVVKSTNEPQYTLITS